MKNIQYVLLFSLAIVFSCASLNTTKNCKKNPIIELDSIQKSLRIINYKIDKPKNWYGSSNSFGAIFYSPNNETNFPYLYAESNYIDTLCVKKFNIDDYLEYYLNARKLKSGKLKYVLSKSNHEKYGRIYIISDKNYSTSEQFISTDFLFLYKEQVFKINYYTAINEYDKFLPDVKKMIESFTISNQFKTEE